MGNQAYTAADHGFRDSDDYARSKYLWTLEVLRTKKKNVRSVLNVGCGFGDFNYMLSSAGYEVWALEPDASAFKAALEARTSVQILNRGIFDHGLERRFDAIVMHDVLEHIHDDSAALIEVTKLLAPDGIFCGSVPALPKLFGLHDELLGHFRRYQRSRLKFLFLEQFDDVKIRYFGLLGIPIVWYFSRFRRIAYPADSVAGSKSLLGKLWKLCCSFERRLSPPLGTSLLFFACANK